MLQQTRLTSNNLSDPFTSTLQKHACIHRDQYIETQIVLSQKQTKKTFKSQIHLQGYPTYTYISSTFTQKIIHLQMFQYMCQHHISLLSPSHIST